VVKTLVISNMINVKLCMAHWSMDHLVQIEMCCTSWRHSQSISIGLSGVHMMAMLAQLTSKLLQVRGPQLVHRWAIMSAMETLVNPKVSLLSSTRYKQSTASKICFLISSSLTIVAIVSPFRIVS